MRLINSDLFTNIFVISRLVVKFRYESPVFDSLPDPNYRITRNLKVERQIWNPKEPTSFLDLASGNCRFYSRPKQSTASNNSFHNIFKFLWGLGLFQYTIKAKNNYFHCQFEFLQCFERQFLNSNIDLGSRFDSRPEQILKYLNILHEITIMSNIHMSFCSHETPVTNPLTPTCMCGHVNFTYGFLQVCGNAVRNRMDFSLTQKVKSSASQIAMFC